MSEVNEEVRRLLQTLSLEERQLLNKILQIEYEKLYMAKPRGALEDCLKATREIIK